MATAATITRSQVLNEMKEKLGLSNSYCNEIERLGREIKDSCKTPNIDDFTPIPIPKGFLALVHALDVCLLTNGDPQNHCDKQSWVRTENLSEWDNKNRERINKLDEVSIDKIYKGKDSSTINKIKSDFRAITSGNLNQHLCYDFSLMYQLLYSARKSEFYVLHYGTTFEQSLSSVRFFIKLYLKEGYYTPLIYNETLHSILNNPSYSLVNHLLKLLNKEFVERTELQVHYSTEVKPQRNDFVRIIPEERTLQRQPDSITNEGMYESFVRYAEQIPRSIIGVGSERQGVSEMRIVSAQNENTNERIGHIDAATVASRKKVKNVLDHYTSKETKETQRNQEMYRTQSLQQVKEQGLVSGSKFLQEEVREELADEPNLEKVVSIESVRSENAEPELDIIKDTVEAVDQVVQTKQSEDSKCLVFKNNERTQLVVQPTLQTQGGDELSIALDTLGWNISEIAQLSQSQNQQRINEIEENLQTCVSELETLEAEKNSLVAEINATSNVCKRTINDQSMNSGAFLQTAMKLFEEYKAKANSIQALIQQKVSEIEQLELELS